MTSSKHPPNSDVRQLIEAFVARRNRQASYPKGSALTWSEEIQDGFMAASFPPGALERIRTKIGEVIPGLEDIKVRSSANAEDVPNFDGAGLHDSYAADTDKRDRPIGPCLVEVDYEQCGWRGQAQGET